jgi:hypothetical protein
MDEKAIMAAVDRLNEQLTTLPDNVPCSLDGLYPDFEFPDDCGPQMYLAVLVDEIQEVEETLLIAPEAERQQLRTMLLECAIALRSAGVE